VIIPLTPDLLPACVALYVETFTAPPWEESWTLDDAAVRLLDFLTTPRAHGVVARADGEVVGFALGHLERSGAEDHFLLQEMCVRPERQGHGHGSRLLGALADELEHVTHWYLLTLRDGRAAAFYERHGFRPARRIGVYVRP
jgi:aminoglycoside 6'-N-acetyltransferase I